MSEGTEILKKIWREIMKEINNDNYPKAEEIIRYYNDESSSTSILRMVLDTTNCVKDVKPFDELHKSILEKIEQRIGKIY